MAERDLEKKKDEYIIEKAPDWLKKLDVRPMLLAELLRKEVIRETDKMTLKALIDPVERTDKLIEILRRGSVEGFMNFCDVLTKSNQQHLIEDLPECLRKTDITPLTAPADSMQEGTQPARPPQTEPGAAKPWMKSLDNRHRDFSKRLRIFKNERDLKKYVADITHLYTRLQLRHPKDCFGDRLCDEDVTLEEVLDHRTKTVVLEGSPGSGKTCALLHILTTAGEGMLNKDDDEKQVYKVMKDIKSLIYIRVQDCRDTLDDTVREIFGTRCASYGDEPWDHYKNHPEETAILVDSLDEISDKHQLVNDILREMETGQHVVIAGCRTNDCTIDSITNAGYVTHVEVIGFNRDAILRYIEMYFSSEELLPQVKDFEQILKEDKRLLGLFALPMSLSIVCILVKAKKYEVKNLSGLTKVQIYTKLEELALQGEGLQLTKDERDDNLKAFHKYCLGAIVNNSGFHKNEMEELGIKTEYLPFITIGEGDASKHDEGCEILLPHKSFIEYSAAKGLLDCSENQQEELLLYLASKRDLSHTLFFILEMMQPSEEKLTRIVKLILALQVEFDLKWHFPYFICNNPNFLSINKQVSGTNINDILQGKKQVNANTYNLGPCEHCWEKSNLASTAEGRAALQNAQDCLNTSLCNETRARVFSETVKLFLPEK